MGSALFPAGDALGSPGQLVCGVPVALQSPAAVLMAGCKALARKDPGCAPLSSEQDMFGRGMTFC